MCDDKPISTESNEAYAKRKARFRFWLNETKQGMSILGANIASWRADKGFETHWKNVPTKLMLVVTELGEAMEAYRHLTDKTLNHCMATATISDEKQIEWLANFKEELADTVIRLLDLTGSLGIDIDHAVAEKMVVNEARPRKHGKEL
jgi:NTP pyrophosphatase (non-canonical NTP hydrolase)